VPFHGEGYKLEIWGREGTLVASTADGPNIGPWELYGSKGNAPLERMVPPSEYVFVPEDMPKGPPYNIAQIYVRAADALKGGQQFKAPTFADAVKHHKLLDAIERASVEGRSISID
jgi:predicted dehydrogenase